MFRLRLRTQGSSVINKHTGTIRPARGCREETGSFRSQLPRSNPGLWLQCRGSGAIVGPSRFSVSVKSLQWYPPRFGVGSFSFSWKWEELCLELPRAPGLVRCCRTPSGVTQACTSSVCLSPSAWGGESEGCKALSSNFALFCFSIYVPRLLCPSWVLTPACYAPLGIAFRI